MLNGTRIETFTVLAEEMCLVLLAWHAGAVGFADL